MLFRRVSVFMVPLFLVFGTPSFAQHPCDAYPAAAKAFTEANWDEAISGFQNCLEKYPKDAKLNFMLGLAHETKGEFDMAISHWAAAIQADPLYEQFLRDRFDTKSQGIGRGVVHDHFGAKFCYGLFFVAADKIFFRSLWGFPRLGTDDSFETPLSNIAAVEVKAKERGRGWVSNMPKRVELHFRFKEKIKGTEDVWSRDEMKFFYGVTQITQTDVEAFARNLLLYLEKKGIVIRDAE